MIDTANIIKINKVVFDNLAFFIEASSKYSLIIISKNIFQ